MRIQHLDLSGNLSKRSDGIGYGERASYSRKRGLKLLPFLLSVPIAYFFISQDSDGDGLSNKDELLQYHTNPFSKDSNNDGFTDYEDVYGKEIIIFKNEKFVSSGWESKYKKVELPQGTSRKIEIDFEASSDNDLYSPMQPNNDRLYGVSVVTEKGEIELHRGVTEFTDKLPTSIHSVEDITPYASVLRGKLDFGAFITTSQYNNTDHSWDVTVKLKFYPGEMKDAPDGVLPAFYMETVIGDVKSKKILFPDSIKKSVLNLHATGHNAAGEEYRGRNVVIKVDGKEIARTYVGNFYMGHVRGGWNPGQGTIPPIRMDIGDKIKPGQHEVTVEVPGSGSYWKISLDILYDT